MSAVSMYAAREARSTASSQLSHLGKSLAMRTRSLTNVHASLAQGIEHLDIVSLGSDGCNDGAVQSRRVSNRVESVELNAGPPRPRSKLKQEQSCDTHVLRK